MKYNSQDDRKNIQYKKAIEIIENIDKEQYLYIYQENKRF